MSVPRVQQSSFLPLHGRSSPHKIREYERPRAVVTFGRVLRLLSKRVRGTGG